MRIARGCVERGELAAAREEGARVGCRANEIIKGDEVRTPPVEIRLVRTWVAEWPSRVTDGGAQIEGFPRRLRQEEARGPLARWLDFFQPSGRVDRSLLGARVIGCGDCRHEIRTRSQGQRRGYVRPCAAM